MPLWGGRFREETDRLVKEFTSSIEVDRRLYRFDIMGSIAHVKMLSKCGIIEEEESQRIIGALEDIKEDIEKGKLDLEGKEDIHLAIEEELIKRTGEVGKKIHTGRSRNDQIALDERLYLREEIDRVTTLIKDLQGVLLELAERNLEVILPGYTHLQYAQPILLSQFFLAYFWMLERDRQRLRDCYKRVNVMPLGTGALAGTSLPIDRDYVANLLNFPQVTENSLDTVSDRDYVIECLSCLSILMMHLSRLSEDLILWTCPSFSFVEIPDAFCTGSSIMPQKKNPDVAELIRGKAGGVYGSLISVLTTMKALPLSYNRDMQEDKLPLFQALDTTKESLSIYARMLANIRINAKRMREEAGKGFFAATDLTDYLVEKGAAFREAHKIVGEMVKYCEQKNKSFQSLTLKEYKSFSPLFTEDVLERVSLQRCVMSKNSAGGTGKKSVLRQIKMAKERLNGDL